MTELIKEEYDFLLTKQLSRGYSDKTAREIVGSHCEQIEDIVLDYEFFN